MATGAMMQGLFVVQARISRCCRALLPLVLLALVTVLMLAPVPSLAEGAGAFCRAAKAAGDIVAQQKKVEAKLAQKSADLKALEGNITSSEQDYAYARLKSEVDILSQQLAELVYGEECMARSGELVLERSVDEPGPRTRGLGGGGTARKAPSVAVEADNTPKPGAPSDNFEMDVYFATTRAVDANANAAADDRFTATHGGKVLYGRAVVSIPKSHKEGNLELPTWLRFERVADPDKHFVLKSATLVDSEPLRAEIAERLAKTERKAALVFVHGFYTSFPAAAYRAAQLAYDLKFKGLPWFFSWPSLGKVTGYAQDGETARLSEPLFEAFLDNLYGMGFDDIYLVAHSMGSRIASAGFSGRIAKGGDVTKIRALLLAAPDLNETLYREQIAPQFAKLDPPRTTIYASSSDIALKASRFVNGYRRIGETDGGVGSYQGAEMVDSSGVSTIYRGFGHSYVVDSTEVLGDIGNVIAQGKAAAERGLVKKGAEPSVYWAFK